MGKSGLKITNDILEKVLHGMENQLERLFWDPSDGLLKKENNKKNSLIPLPKWSSEDGYLLMKQFVASLPEEGFSQQLKKILASGSGVFRHFKNALAERPEIHKAWRRYKEQEMRTKALDWFSRCSDALELEGLGSEPEDWDDLIPSDFTIRRAKDSDVTVIEYWNQEAINEISPESSRQNIQWELSHMNRPMEEFLVAETPMGQFVGFAWIHINKHCDFLNGRIMQLYVQEKYRGLGIGRMLMLRCIDESLKKGAQRISIQIPSSLEILNPWLENNGFQEQSIVWQKDLTVK